MKKILPVWIKGFSLIELMISLIVISIVTAAFAPVISKKIKSIDSSVSKSVDYNFDESFCNTVKENCTICTGSECVKCKDGYYLDNDECKICPEGCKTCSNESTCESCSDEYFKSGSDCKKCPNHCKICSSSSICTKCNDGYFSHANVCYKYSCDSFICTLTQNDNVKLQLYRYQLGDGKLSDLASMGISTCYANSSCNASGPICWHARPTFGYLTSPPTTCIFPPKSSYSLCTRSICNGYAATYAANKLKTEGWRLPTNDDAKYISAILYGAYLGESTADPLPVALTHEKVWMTYGEIYGPIQGSPEGSRGLGGGSISRGAPLGGTDPNSGQRWTSVFDTTSNGGGYAGYALAVILVK